MAYQCVDCSYKGKKFPQGACPSCGSNNIRGLKIKKDLPDKVAKPYRLVFAAALWCYLGFEIYKKIM